MTVSDVTVPHEVAQRVFDTAVNSLDFGSGFLDTEEVDALRAFAVLIGVDPMNATPGGFRMQYAHEFVPEEAKRYPAPPPRNPEAAWLAFWDDPPQVEMVVVCKWCGLEKHRE